MLRSLTLLRAALLVLGLIPVGIWIALADALEPAGLGRSIGKAILVVFTPVAVGGVMMILAAALFGARPRVGRVLATVGVVIVTCGALFFAVVWIRRYVGCGGPAGICTPELLQTLGLVAYAFLHAGLAVPIWRARRDAEADGKFPAGRAPAAK